MVWDAIIPILLQSKLLKGSQDELIPLHCTNTNYLLTVKVIHQSERQSEVISVHTVHGKQTLWIGKDKTFLEIIPIPLSGHNTLHFNGRKNVQTSRWDTGVIKKSFQSSKTYVVGAWKSCLIDGSFKHPNLMFQLVEKISILCSFCCCLSWPKSISMLQCKLIICNVIVKLQR